MDKSSFSRILTGSIAAWIQIALNLIAQGSCDAFFLSFWTIQQYGIWLTFQALTGFLQFIDAGHQSYIGNKFLISGANKKSEIEVTLSSSILIAMLFFCIQIILLAIIYNTSLIGSFLKGTTGTLFTLKILILAHMVVWGLTGSIGGLLIRSLSPFGHYSKFGWWGAIMQIATIFMPIIPVFFGGGVFEAGLVTIALTLLVNLGILSHIKILFKAENIKIVKPNFKSGLKNFSYSLALSFNNLLEMFRQQGARLILSPLSGASQMAAFSTIRTGANVAIQGLHSITGPLLPELMRFLGNKDQERSEASFATVWVVVIGIMCPAVVLLQVIMPFLFPLWTRGHIEFNPFLFAILSLSVLVYALAQPAIAIVTANNLLKPQLIISAIAFVVVIASMWLLVPLIGILGAGVSLLFAEIVATSGYRIMAKKWLRTHGLFWPDKQAKVAAISICISALSMLLIIYFTNFKWFFVVIAFCLLGFNLKRYLQILPLIATGKIKAILNKLPFINNLFSI